MRSIAFDRGDAVTSEGAIVAAAANSDACCAATVSAALRSAVGSAGVEVPVGAEALEGADVCDEGAARVARGGEDGLEPDVLDGAVPVSEPAEDGALLSVAEDEPPWLAAEPEESDATGVELWGDEDAPFWSDEPVGCADVSDPEGVLDDAAGEPDDAGVGSDEGVEDELVEEEDVVDDPVEDGPVEGVLAADPDEVPPDEGEPDALLGV